MLDIGAELQVRSLLIWQAGAVITVAAVVFVLSSGSLAILFGGCLTILSTWHVHRSVCISGVDRVRLLKLAGIRFAFFLLALAVGISFFALEPVALIAGVVTAYVAMYIGGLIMSFKNMKGDGLG
ncbi:MAG: hypothetical protein Q9N02_00395 [Ghiorsea sp.]|nr:hypothetical protein [Ghiorsea sp.]